MVRAVAHSAQEHAAPRTLTIVKAATRRGKSEARAKPVREARLLLKAKPVRDFCSSPAARLLLELEKGRGRAARLWFRWSFTRTGGEELGAPFGRSPEPKLI